MVRSQKRRTKQKLAKEQEKDTVQILVTLLKQKLDLKQNIKSLLTLITLTGAAIGGRIALQHVPSVETITPFSILAGFMLGPIYGFVSGASGFYISNYFVWGGQGPWTIFQALGAGAAGLIAGILGKIWKNFKFYMFSVLLGILAYELIVDIGGALLFFGLLSIPFYMLTSLPFTAVHLFSSLAICSILWGFRKSLPKLEGKIIEKYKLGFGADTASGIGKLRPEFFLGERYRVQGNRSELINRLLWRKRKPE